MFDIIEIISFNCKEEQGILFPDDNGDIEFIAKFHKMTYEKFNEIESKINKNEYTYNEVKRNYLKNLISINLLEGIDGVYFLPYKVVSKMLELYMEKCELSDDDEFNLNKQSSLVFNGKPVMNAHEGISLYCLLSSFYEKFGMTLKDIKNLPYKQFLELKLLMSKENDIKVNSNKKSSKNTGRKTNIAGVKPSGPSQIIEM